MSKQLLYFSTTWCGPCQQFKPIMAEVSQSIPVQMIDAENSPLAGEYFIRTVPTVLLVENGREISRFSGVKTKQQVLEFYNNNY